MKDDRALLHEFARYRSQSAFAELVGRHLGRVYAVARRGVGGDAGLAEEVVQTVFAALARKAGALARRESISGWLFVGVRYAAADAVRKERTRRRALEKAVAMNALVPEPGEPVDWEGLRTLLDEAVYRLKDSDREAVLLRFYDECSYAEVAAKLQVGESAARMRVDRALEKLRQSLGRLGVTSSAAALASGLSAQTTGVTLPSGLAAVVVGQAGAPAAGSAGWALLQFMSLNKTAAVAAIVILALAGTGAYQTWTNHQLQRKLAEAAQDNAPWSGLREEHVQLIQRQAAFEAASAAEEKAQAAPLPPRQTIARRLPVRVARTLAEAVAAGGPVYDHVDEAPIPIDRDHPRFPGINGAPRKNGDAEISFVVTTDGGVVDAMVTKASAPEFGEAALAAVQLWLYQPGKIAGRAVNTRITAPIIFALNPQ